MKHAPKTTPIINETEHFCGIALGRLFAAEQECGIRPIQEAFGISAEQDHPIYRRHQVHICPENLVLVQSPKDSLLIYSPNAAENFQRRNRTRSVKTDSRFPHDLPSSGNRLLGGAWIDKGFAIYAVREGQDYLRTIFYALGDLDGSVFVADHSFSPFFWGNLCIMISSRTPLAFWPDGVSSADESVMS